MKLVFSHPEQKKKQLPVIPVFMPFAGCRVRCVFCSQTAQTGKDERELPLILQELEKTLQGFASSGKGQLEVAFYGGTFTGLPVGDQARCLEVTQRWRERGLVSRVRCSTRPDFIDRESVQFLRAHGVSLVELGVQSFSDTALATSKRNYTAACVREACRTVREGGLELGIQLMPGLPGASLEESYEDILLAVAQQPACVRLYPCLVFAGTPLANLWATGEYSPLGLEETVQLLAHACLIFWEHDVPVIRMGVAPEPSAMEKLLAGPFHYSLGNMVRAQALYNFIADRVRQFRDLLGSEYPGAPANGKTTETTGIQTYSGASGALSAEKTPEGSKRLEPANPSGLRQGLAHQNGGAGGEKRDRLAVLKAMGRCGDSSGTLPISFALHVPEKYQGEFWGFKGQLKDRYAALGMEEVTFHRHTEFFLELATGRPGPEKNAIRCERAVFHGKC